MKKLKLSVLLTMLTLVALCAHGQTANRLIIPDVSVQSGKDVQIPVKVENTSEIVAVQFDLTVPDGFTISPDVTLTDRSQGHTITAKPMSGNTLRIMSYSQANSPFKGNSGTLMYINAQVSAALEEGSVHQLVISDPILSQRSGDNALTEAVAGSITIEKSPDLTVSDVKVNKQSIAPGDTVNISWTVANIGGRATSSGWKEQIYLVNDRTSKLIGTTYHDDALAASGRVSRQAIVAVPEIVGIDGEVYVEVKLIPYSDSGEPISAQGNNTSRSEMPMTLSKVLTLTIPIAIDETNGSAVRCLLSRSGDSSNDGVFIITVAHADSRITVPESVTIPAGQPSVYFYLTVKDNDEIDDNDLLTFTVSGEGYDDVEGAITIVDDEIPALTLTITPESITEGETITLLITAERASAADLPIRLYCDAASRFAMPLSVILPAGRQELTVEIASIDDQEVQHQVDPLFKIAADGYESAEAVITLLDNDMPEIALEVTPTTVSESAGYNAILAKIRRLTKTENTVTIKLTDTSNGKLAYPSTIVLAKGIEEYSFNIGVNDNNIVDGDQDIELTAAVYISSCDCTAGTSGGEVSQTITVLDNDGPSLSIVANTATWLEGSKSQILTITRNTPTDEPLTVNVTSDNDDLLVYEQTVVIPAGTASAEVTVAVKSNDVNGDSSTIVFTAEAEGHTAGKCWVMISDQSLPDANIPSLTIEPAEAEVDTSVAVTVTVKNDGVVPMPAKTKVCLYITGQSEPATTLWTKSAILPGDTMTLDGTLTVPSRPGEYNVTATVNEEQAFAELTYVNNRSRSVTLTAIGAFTATVSPDRTTYLPGETIMLTGKATGTKGANAEVEIYLINSGRHTVKAVTDGEGNFTAEWTPYPQQSGHVTIGACYPGENVTTEMSSADIYGLRVQGNSWIPCQAVIGETFRGSFKLVNGTSLPLRGVTATATGVPDYCTIDINCPTTIDGDESATVDFTIDATAISEGTDWEYITVTVTTAEGLAVPVTLCYYCYNTKGTLKSNMQSINTTMTKGASRDYQFIVTNVGKGETGRISLQLPDWMQAATAMEMPSMAPGDTVTVVLRLAPTPDMPLNGYETGALSLVCTNGEGLTIPFKIEVVSESTGTLTIDVCDENTYNTATGDHVHGATVEVRHPINGTLIATGTTDESGKCSFVLPEGYYSINATAENHQTITGFNVLVDPGTETLQTLTLSLAGGIDVNFEVERIEVEDGYQITIKLGSFQVDVPVPVVELSLPSDINIDNMALGESVIVTAALTNKGLIMANDAQLTLPTDIPGVTFESLLDQNKFDISPQQSIFIPIKITKLSAANGTSTDIVAKYPCTVTFSLIYYWACGPDRKWHLYSVPVQIGKCKTSVATPSVVSSYGGGGGGGGIGFGPIGGGGGGGAYSSSSSVAVTRDKGCEPCQNSLRNKMATYSVSRLPAIVAIWGDIGINDYNFTPSTNTSALAMQLMGVYASKPIGYEWTSIYRRWLRIYNVAVEPLFEPCATTPAYVDSYLRDLKLVADGANAQVALFREIFGDEQWLECDDEELGNFLVAFAQYTQGIINVNALVMFCPQAVTEEHVYKFVERWTNTMGNAESDNKMDYDTLLANTTTVSSALKYAEQSGYDNVADFYSASEDEVLKGLNDASNSVCSTISLELSQTMTMTREAFRATLTVDNSTDKPMTGIQLNIDIIDDEGRIATSHEFEQRDPEITGFHTGARAPGDVWTLDANTRGVAQIVFIPTKYAAPDSSRVYSFTGTLSYNDVYTGVPVARDLFPVDMEVSPSPVLDMTYFMQRDVLGDDPLTEEVEPIIPAEFALLINNVGNGDANNVKFVTNRPQVTANDKSLYIQFDLLSSLLNGEEANVAIDGNVPTDFGTIPAHTTAYAQWYFTASLLGHFLDYDVEVNHLTSYGNKDLSLLGDVTIHELIRSLDLSDADHEHVTGFLVNDIADSEDTPDNLYVTDGTIETVGQLTSISMEAVGVDRYTLSVGAASAGWAYGHVVDPTAGYSTIQSVTRRSDGKAISLRNVWQTDRTLRDGKEPLYEYLIHIADNLSAPDEVYDIVFTPRPDLVLAVDAFIGLPASDELLTTSLESLEVVFNKGIKAETFTTDDLTLTCQGRELDASAIGIEAVSDRRFRLDVSALTLPNGYYVLTVQTTGIVDGDGLTGEVGAKASWVQYIDGKAILTITTTEGGTATPETGAFDLHSDITLLATPDEGYNFVGWRHDGEIVSTDAEYIVTLDGDETFVAEFTPRIFCEAPVIHYNGRFATITCATPDATIYFTCDGSAIDESSAEYTSEFDTHGICTITAIATKDNYEPSTVTTYEVPAYYDGEVATCVVPDSLSVAFGWIEPSEIETLLVRGVMADSDFDVFRRLGSLKYLDLYETIALSLPERAFEGSQLVHVVMPREVEIVGSNVFAGCETLGAITWNSELALPVAAFDRLAERNTIIFTNYRRNVPAEVTNVVVGDMAERIVLTDEGGPVYVPYEFKAQSISYTRNFKQTTPIGGCAGWESLSLPFDVQTVTHEREGEITSFADSRSGFKHFWLYGVGDEGFVRDSLIAANTPYVISMPNNEEYIDSYCLNGVVTFSSNSCILPVTESYPRHMAYTDDGFSARYNVWPTMATVYANDDVYALNVGMEVEGYAAGSVFVRGLREIYPFEAYITQEPVGARTRVLEMARMFDDEDPSGIIGVTTDPLWSVTVYDGTLYISSGVQRMVNIHDASGRLIKSFEVEAGVTPVRDLTPGLYIVNGTKAIIK